MQPVVGYTSRVQDHKGHEEIWTLGLPIYNLNKIIVDYKCKWTKHERYTHSKVSACSSRQKKRVSTKGKIETRMKTVQA